MTRDDASHDLRRLIQDDLGRAALGGETAEVRFALFDAVARSLSRRAEHAPLLVVLEDFHDADIASLQLLVFVAEHLRAARAALMR